MFRIFVPAMWQLYSKCSGGGYWSHYRSIYLDPEWINKLSCWPSSTIDSDMINSHFRLDELALNWMLHFHISSVMGPNRSSQACRASTELIQGRLSRSSQPRRGRTAGGPPARPPAGGASEALCPSDPSSTAAVGLVFWNQCGIKNEPTKVICRRGFPNLFS